MTAILASSYRIASGDTLTNLEKAVNQALVGGWQPYGPPFMTHDHRVVQAMILPQGVKPAPGSAPTPTGASAVSTLETGAKPQAAPPVQPPAQQQAAAAAAPAAAPVQPQQQQSAQQLFAQPAQAQPVPAGQPQRGVAPTPG